MNRALACVREARSDDIAREWLSTIIWFIFHWHLKTSLYWPCTFKSGYPTNNSNPGNWINSISKLVGQVIGVKHPNSSRKCQQLKRHTDTLQTGTGKSISRWWVCKRLYDTVIWCCIGITSDCDANVFHMVMATSAQLKMTAQVLVCEACSYFRLALLPALL